MFARVLRLDERMGGFPPRIGYGAAMQAELDRWFTAHILVHEDALVRFLRRGWPQREDIVDLRQEL